MAKSVLDIVIKIQKEGGADKETIQGLVALKRSILDAAAVGATLVTAAYAIKKGLDETVGTMVAYADQVRRIQNATGQSAEESSKLIQVLDDQKISYDQLEKAIQKSGKAFDFSINGLAAMSDEYLKLKDAQSQASFMQERFGKQWISFVPIMQQGGRAIQQAANAVDDSLVLTQKGVDQARQYEIAMDNWSDAVMGVKVSIGSQLLPVLTALISTDAQVTNAQNALNEAQKTHTVIVANNYEAAQRLRAAHFANVEAASAHGEALMGLNESAAETVVSQKDLAEAAKEASAAFTSSLGLITNIANENKNFADKQTELTQKMAENRAEAEALYPWQQEQLTQLDQKYAEMASTYEANAQAHNAAMNRIQYDLLVTKLSADGLTEAEYAIAQQAGLTFGVFDQKSIDTAMNMDKVAQAVERGVIQVGDMNKVLGLLPSLKTVDVVINALVSMSQGAQAAYFQSGGNTTHTQQTQQGGFADGGISTGPATGHMELLHGTEAVIPLKNGAVPVQMQSLGGGGNVTNVNVQLTIASPMTIFDQQTAQNTLLPFIVNGIREAKARGQL